MSNAVKSCAGCGATDEDLYPCRGLSNEREERCSNCNEQYHLGYERGLAMGRENGAAEAQAEERERWEIILACRANSYPADTFPTGPGRFARWLCDMIKSERDSWVE